VSVHDRWRGARTGSGKRWECRWRDGGRQRKRRFDSRAAAERFEAQRRLAPEIRQAEQGRTLTIAELMTTWLATKTHLRPKTLDAYRADAREVTATFGDRLAVGVKPSEIRVWVARDRGVSLRRRSLTALGQAYRIAVADGLLTASPCVGIRAPKAPGVEPRFLTFAELERLAKEAGDSGPMIWLLGTCGLRLGEAIGLQVGDVNLARSRVRVARSVVVASGGAVVGPPKSGKGRDVPVPAFVLDMLPVDGRGAGEWLFPAPQGGHLDQSNWRNKVFQPAAKAAGVVGLHPHALRHTAASLAIEMGADVLMVQRMLGHASPAITLGIYAHRWDENLNSVAKKMDDWYRGL
jgi:integrase